MSYASRAALARDPGFISRVVTCSKEQALVFMNDGRPDIAALGDAIVLSSTAALPLVELVAVSPNFVDVTDQTAVPDVEILSAVQAVWPTYAGVAYPAAEPEGGE